MKVRNILTLLLLPLLFDCKKSGTESGDLQGKLAEMPHFIPNKGFAYLASYSENNGGSISLMNSIDIFVTPDNRLH